MVHTNHMYDRYDKYGGSLLPVTPFTPGVPAQPENFAGRRTEIEIFKKILSNVNYGRSSGIIIHGIWGIGKTSLLRKFEEVARNLGFIICRESIPQTITTPTNLYRLMLQSFDKSIDRTKTTFEKIEKTYSDIKENLTIGINWFLTAEFSPQPEIPEIKFRDTLLQVWKELEGKYPGIVLMFDNTEFLPKVEGFIHALRAIFEKLAEEKCNYLLILSGQLGLFEKIIEAYHPVRRFFENIELNPFTYEETKEAIELATAKSPVKFLSDSIEQIHKISGGHPYFIHVFGEVAYLEANSRGTKEINSEIFNTSKDLATSFLERRVFESQYPKEITKKKIINALAKYGELSYSEIIERTEIKGQPTKAISELIGEGIILKISRGRYRLYQSLFSDYVNRKQI